METNSHNHFQDLNDDLGTILTARKIDQIVEADDESQDGDVPMANGSGDGTAAGTMAAAAAQGRMMRKHRKGQRAHSISEEGKFGSTKGAAGAGPGGALSVVPNGPVRTAKNSKKSRTGFGRGLPKKGEIETLGARLNAYHLIDFFRFAG